MTKEDLEKLKELAKKAEPGPWVSHLGFAKLLSDKAMSLGKNE